MGFLQNTLSVIGFRFLSLPIGLATSIILARGLNPEAYGQLGLALAFLNMVCGLALMGIPAANVYNTSRHPEHRASYVANSTYYSLGLGLFLALIWFLAAPLLAQHYFENKVSTALLYWLAPVLPLMLLYSLLPSLLVGAERIQAYNFSQISLNLAKLAVFSYLLFGLGLGLKGALAGQVAVYCLAAGFSLWLVMRLVASGYRLDWPRFKQALSFGWRNHLGELSLLASRNLVIMSFGLVLPGKEVGYILLAWNLAATATLPLNSAMVPLRPRLVRAGDDSASLAGRVFRVSMLLSSGLFLVLALTSSWLLVFLYGTAYSEAAFYFRMLLAAELLRAAVGPLQAHYLAKAAFLSLTGQRTIRGVLSVSLCWAGSFWGGSGMVTGLLVSNALATLTVIILFTKLTNCPAELLLKFQENDRVYLRQAWGGIFANIKRLVRKR